MPVILETISWILKNVNVGVDRLIVGYGVRFVYSDSLYYFLPFGIMMKKLFIYN